MDVKEKVFRNIVIKMGNVLNKEQHEMLRRVLTTEFEECEIEYKEKKELPSVYSERNERLIQEFLVSKKINGLSKKSLKFYEYTLKRFTDMFDIDLLNVDTNHIRMYFYRLEKLGNSEVTVDNNRRNLNSFFQWLLEEEYISKNPVAKIKRIKGEQKEKKPYSDIEITKFKDSCTSPRDKAILDILLTTGIRNSELCGIMLKDVDFYDKSILIHGKGNKQRTVYLSDGCLFHINKYLQDRDKRGIVSEYLFCSERKNKYLNEYSGLSSSGLRSIVKNMSKNADVMNSYPHKFRRTFGCTMLDYSDLVTVQTLMGHSSISTTRMYVTADKKKARYEHSKLRMCS